MPKLPEGKSPSILEVAEKGQFNRGELVVPKPARHRVVFKHHLKLAAFLLALCVLLVLVFVFAKPMFLKEEALPEQTQVKEVEQFEEPNEAVLNYPNLEYTAGVIVDRIDLETKIIYGRKVNPETGEYSEITVRVLDQTEINAEPPRGEISSPADTRAISDIKAGNLLFVLATEDPRENKYLNARNIVIR